MRVWVLYRGELNLAEFRVFLRERSNCEEWVFDTSSGRSSKQVPLIYFVVVATLTPSLPPLCLNSKFHWNLPGHRGNASHRGKWIEIEIGSARETPKRGKGEMTMVAVASSG